MKLAVVTGGATGIGAATCRALAREGFAVAVHHRSSHDTAEALAAELPGAFTVRGDLATDAGVEAVAAAVAARPEPLAVLVNNAGIVADAPFLRASLDELDRVFDLNVRGTWHLTRRLARMMHRRREGRIVNVSSVVGTTGNPFQSVYGMSKAAIDNLTRTLAVELAGYGILVNGVAPGLVDTAMTQALPEEARAALLARVPLGRMGRPDEVAELVAFLATRGTYCTGAIFHVNGGLCVA